MRGQTQRDRVAAADAPPAEGQVGCFPDHGAAGIGGKHRPPDVVGADEVDLIVLDHREGHAIRPGALADERPAAVVDHVDANLSRFSGERKTNSQPNRLTTKSFRPPKKRRGVATAETLKSSKVRKPKRHTMSFDWKAAPTDYSIGASQEFPPQACPHIISETMILHPVLTTKLPATEVPVTAPTVAPAAVQAMNLPAFLMDVSHSAMHCWNSLLLSRGCRYAQSPDGQYGRSSHSNLGVPYLSCPITRQASPLGSTYLPGFCRAYPYTHAPSTNPKGSAWIYRPVVGS